MSVRWERFSGDTSTFALKIAFHADPDEGGGIDADTAVSWGALQVWVDGINLCSHVDQGETLQASHWYLLPIFEWLVSSWDPLLHEERLPSPSNRFETAADLASAMPSLLYAADAAASHALVAADEQRFHWEQRHSLRAARDGGLLPDVRFRRLRDQIEISWNHTPLAGAHDVEFIAPQGRSFQEPAHVASALFEVLSEGIQWLLSQRPSSDRFHALAAECTQLRSSARAEERTAWLAGLGSDRTQVIDRWRTVKDQVKPFAEADAFEGSFAVLSRNELVVDGSCEAALLFGSVSPHINDDDALDLARLLLDNHSLNPSDGLDDLVRDEPPDPAISAWEHGYELATSVLDEAGDELLVDRPQFNVVDVEKFLTARGIKAQRISLSDKHIRAVSFAGPNHVPTLALNESSPFFASAHARRFTLAHELCHLLFDRTRGARLAVASGQWAPTVIEQRANAFAAMLLMPPELLAGAIAESDKALDTPAAVEMIASRLNVSRRAVLEHMYNMGLIDDAARDYLRATVDQAR